MGKAYARLFNVSKDKDGRELHRKSNTLNREIETLLTVLTTEDKRSQRLLDFLLLIVQLS